MAHLLFPMCDWPPWQCDIFVFLLDWGHYGHQKQCQEIISSWLTLPNRVSFAVLREAGEDSVINNCQSSVSCQKQQILSPSRNQNSNFHPRFIFGNIKKIYFYCLTLLKLLHHTVCYLSKRQKTCFQNNENRLKTMNPRILVSCGFSVP